MAKDGNGIKIVCQNRKARHQYHIEDTYEAGLVLIGAEVKSLRESRANIADGYVDFRSGEAWLHNVHISPYPHSGPADKPDPTRTRKLLLNRREIRKLMGKTQERGYTIIPLKIYFRNGRAKVEIALAKGKKLYDKRETMRRKTLEREFQKKYKIR
ncbi:MAG TPA: SsrA-binding protein SmpB [Thermodesulfobacteriaceae bacterium]|nr:SsrA-binding protein SmpB [Thermodesulfobacteriaceae bacterium]